GLHPEVARPNPGRATHASGRAPRRSVAGLPRRVGVEQETAEYAAHHQLVSTRRDALAIEWTRAKLPGEQRIIDDVHQRRGDLIPLEVHEERLPTVQCLAARRAGDDPHKTLGQLVLPDDGNLARGDLPGSELGQRPLSRETTHVLR